MDRLLTRMPRPSPRPRHPARHGPARDGLACGLTAALIAGALALAGCATVPDDSTDRAAALPALPEQFAATDPRWTTAAPADARFRGTWWRVFADPVLDDLVARAERDHPSIRIATARLAQARALARATDAGRQPQATLAAGGTRVAGPLINAAGAEGTLTNLTGSLSYEVDLFGRLARTSEAAVLDADAREALLQGTRLLVQAGVAQAYFALRAVDEERRLVRGTLAAQDDALALTERRFRAGLVAELDLERARTEQAAIAAEGLALERQRGELEHALALMIGELAGVFRLAERDWDTALPTIPPGIPATVLARRPDVAAAQRALLAGQARLGAARTAWFPNLTLTASSGFASSELGDLFRSSMRAWGLGALLALPLLDGGRREAGVRSAQAERDALVAAYREQVLVAFRDVEDQLSALRLLADQHDVQARAVAAATRARVLSESRYRSGLVSQLDELDARRTELRNRRLALQVRTARYQATVALVRALGGGWDTAAVAATDAPAAPALAQAAGTARP